MLAILSNGTVQALIQSYGLWVVFALVTSESMGVPVPGETALVSAAIFAGATHSLSIWSVIGTAALAAITGDNIGYAFGRTVGFRLLVAHGRRIGLTDGRLKIGQYLFLRHGGKIVFFGRFLALLRTFAALLAGANCMDWRRFLLMNGAGGIAWATLFGGGAYLFGDRLAAVSEPLGTAALAAVAVAIVAVAVLFRRYEARLEAHARATLCSGCQEQPAE